MNCVCSMQYARRKIDETRKDFKGKEHLSFISPRRKKSVTCSWTADEYFLAFLST